MPLFIRIGLVLTLVFSVRSSIVFGQSCIPFPVYFPDTVCLGQTVSGTNLGSTANQYTWDLCAGDFFRSATTANLLTSPAGAYVGFRMVREGGKYYAFSTQNGSSNLVRYDFDTIPGAAPTFVNLGNPDSKLSNPFGFELIRQGNTWYGFTVNGSTNALVRFAFTSGLGSAPVATTVPVTGLGTAYTVRIVEEGGKYLLFSYSNTSRKINVLDFGADLNSEPVALPSITIPGNVTSGNLNFFADCDGKYGFMNDNSGKVVKVNFGSSFLNANPTIQSILAAPGFSGGVYSVSPFQDGGRRFLLVAGGSSGGLAVFNFGSSFATGAPGITALITGGMSNITSVSAPFWNADGSQYLIFHNAGGILGRINLAGGGCVGAHQTTQYQVPTFVAGTAGKHFVNYAVRLPNGQVETYGDSIFVRSTPSATVAPVFDFEADEQCPSRPTKFFPAVAPAGNYSYRWTFPGNVTSTQTVGSFQFPAAGTYPVRLDVRATNGCGVGSITRSIRIFPNPTVAITSAFAVPAQVCTKDSVLFTDGSTPAAAVRRWKWDFGSNQIYFSSSVKVVFPQSQAGQAISVSLKASDSSGCGTAVSQTVTPAPGADLQFGVSQVCEGQTTQFQNNTPSASGISFFWEFGDPASGTSNTSTSNAPTVPHIFSDSGLFTIRLRGITANGCTSRVSQAVRIFPLPIVQFGFPSVLFPGNTASFTNQTIAPYQTVASQNWNFGDPGSGSNNTSTLVSPTHTYANAGNYPVELSVTTDKGCQNQLAKELTVFQFCPTVNYSKLSPASGQPDSLIVQTSVPQGKETRIDFCAGDLALTPVLQSQQSGAQPISSASQVVPVLDQGNWTAFIPAPLATNATVFFKASYGASLNNDISNFSTSLGSLQNKFTSPLFIRFLKKDSIWYAFACNNDAKLWRIRFGTSLDNNSPTITEITLPQGTLVNPSGAQLVQDKDTTYLFVVNNQASNNVVRLRFAQSLEENPQVSVLNNPLVLQNSNGFFGMALASDCGQWYGLLLASGQLYRLDYGSSLSNTPTAVSLTGAITAGLGSANAFNNMRGITVLQDLGHWYAFLNANNGTLIRARFKNGLSADPDYVSSLGSFGISGTIGGFQFARENSEFFGMTINNTGTIYKIKFPNDCPTAKGFISRSAAGKDTCIYQASGKFYITVTGEYPFGASKQIVDSVVVPNQVQVRQCKTVALNHPDKICFDYQLTPSVQGGPFQNGEWDFCTGDFKNPPSLLAQPASTGTANATGVQVVEAGGNYYVFQCNTNGMNRVNLGSNPEGTPSQPITILTNTGAVGVSGLTDFRIFKEGNQWFAFLIYQTGDVVVRLNFGTDITNTAPTFSLINLPGFLEKPRGIDLFEDRGRKYAVLANQNNGTLTLLQFGSTYRNVPIPSTIEVPTAVNLFKVSMIRDCNIWHAFVSDQAQDSVFHLIFQRGLNGVPTRKMIGMIDAIGLKAVKDGDRFYLFATKTQPTKFNVYKFSFGNSLDQEPATDSLGTFPVTTPASGIQRVYGMEIYKNALSEHFFFGLGTDNSLMYRLKFQNPCSADFPTAQGDTVFNQAYRADGKYYFSYTGLNRAGEQVSGFDSVTVQNLVDADFIIPGNRCKGESILFNDASITGPLTSITSWHWDFADSLATVDTSTLANPTHIFSKAGIYLVRLRVQEQGGCINEIVKSVVVADKPKPAFNVVSNGSLCTNDSIEFSDATVTINDPIVSHLWEVRQNGNLIASSTRQNPRFYFTQTGTYQINLQVKGESQCDSTISRPITIESVGSQVSFSSPTACLGEAVTFVPNITGPAPDSIRWFIDAAGYNVGSGNFTHTFNLNSVFSVRLTVYNQSCANTFTRIVRVNTRPNFSVNAQAPLPCEGLPITFGSNLNTTDPVNYLWEFGDGTTDSVSSPTKIFNSAGTFKVKLLVSTDNGCAGTDSLDFIAKRSPKALFSFDKACKDEPVTFTNLSTANGIPGGITSYFWEFGTITGLTSTAQDPGQILYNEPPGIKIVRLTVRTQEDCPSTYTKEIAIGPKIAANFRKESGCLGTPFRFYDMTAAGVDSIRKWNWSVGGLNYTSQNPIVELSQLGTYDVRLRVESKSGCVDEVTRTAEITVLDSARADFSISGTFNSPPFIAVFRQLPQENPSYSYEWDFGDSTSSSSPNPPPHIYNTEGTYVVTMVATRRETICSTRVQKAVNVISNPLQGIKIRRITVAKGSERISMSAEVENQSNIALRTFRLNFRAGNLLTGSEDWNGIFMPGAIIQVPLQTDLLVKSSQKIPFVCLTASLPDPGKELSPGDNSQCLSLDSFPSLSTMFPNPAANELTVEMSLSSGDPVEIRITNMLGQEFARFESDGLGAGPFRKTFDMRDIPSGMYSVWFRTGTHSESKKLMVLRP